MWFSLFIYSIIVSGHSLIDLAKLDLDQCFDLRTGPIGRPNRRAIGPKIPNNLFSLIIIFIFIKLIVLV